MLRFIHLLLLKLSPELAHSVGVFLLKCYQRAFLGRKAISASSFTIQVPPHFTLSFKSRVGLAAGFDKQAEVFPALSLLGFGFIEVGTVTPLPQGGNPKPRLWRVAPESLVNSLGFNSVGLEVFRRNIERYRSQVKIPLFANIGKNKATPNEDALSDYAKGFEALKHSVDGFVVNLSSPNTPGLRDLQSTAFLQALAEKVPDLPVWIKLSPELSLEEVKAIAEFVLRENRLSGLVLTNTSRALAEGRGMKVGGLSGPPLFSLSLERVAAARAIFKDKKTIIGVGGVSSLAEAKEMRVHGADLVEIYTGFVYRGERLVKELQSLS